MKHQIDYSISVSEDGIYVIMKINGEIRGDVTLRPAIEANELARDVGVAGILADLTEARRKRSVTQALVYVREVVVKEPRISRNIKYAMLVSPDDHSHDFIETAAINAGLIVQLFRIRDQANKYLLKGLMSYLPLLWVWVCKAQIFDLILSC